MTEAVPPSTANLVPLPANEAERLAALRRYNILDTPPEVAFDRITTLAARLFNVPIALVSLVDESRTWFKSCYGFDQSEVPRNISICGLTLLYNEVVVVPDAQQDDRFACNPLVQGETGLRFYAGAPLLTPEGLKLGALCLLDTKPRQALSDEQKAILADLAAIVVDELELRRAVSMQAVAEQKRQQAEEMRQEAAQHLQLYADVVQNAQVGIVVWQLEDLNHPGSFRLLVANPAASAATGLDLQPMVGKTMAESFPKLLQTPLIRHYMEVVRSGRSLDLGEVPYGEDGISPGIYSLKAFPLPNYCFGLAFENITARKQIEAQLQESERYNQQIAEAMPGVLFVHDLIEQQNVYTNRQITELLGYTSEQVQAMGENAVATLVHPDDLERVVSYLAVFCSAPDDAVLGIEYRARHADGQWRWMYSQSTVFNRTVEGLPHQILGVSIDISDRKQIEQALRESEEWARLAIQVAQLGGWRLHLDTNLVEMDQRMRQIWGEPDDAVMIPLPAVLERMHPDDRERVGNAVNAALDPQSSGSYEIEYRVVWDDGTERWVLAKGQAQFEGEGESRRTIDFFGTLLDITDRMRGEAERQQAEAALAEQEQRYRYIFEAVNVSIWEEDFSEVKAAIDQLKATGIQDFRQYFAEHPEFVQQMASLARLQDMNQATLKMLGAQDKTELLTSLDYIFLPETEAAFVGKLLAIAHEAPTFSTETVLQTLQGDRLDVWFTITFPPSSEPYDHVLVSLLDITQRKQAEASVRESEERLRLALTAANQGLYDLNVQTGDGIVSPEYALMLGYNPDEFVETNAKWRDRLHPDDLAMVYQTYEDYIAGRQNEYHVEFRQRTKAGDWKWILSMGKIVSWDQAGQPVRMLGTHTDISDRKQAEQALQQHSERLNLLYETTSELLSAKQPLELMNRLFDKLSAQMDLHYYYHFQVSEQEGQQRLQLMNYGGISQSQAQLFESIELGQAMCGLVAQERRQIVLNQVAIATHPNATFICSMGVSAYAGQPLMVHGRLLGTLSFASLTRTQFSPEEVELLQAISEQVAIALDRAELVASLQQQTEDLAQANRVKDEFLAVLSHELRSPLNPILGWTKLLQTGKFDAQKTKQALEIIERNAKQQVQLIDDLLDISRILRGKLTLSEAPVDLVFTIESALETMRLAAETKNIQIKTDLSASLPPVLGDVGRLQQIVLNLLSNAIKFTPDGGQVEVRLQQVEGRSQESGAESQKITNGLSLAPTCSYAQITVTDTGKGITPDFLPYVFESFRQEDGRTTRKFGGLGLGLAIVRQLTELHGGTVRAQSLGEGAGATFTIRLPLMKTQSLGFGDANSTDMASNETLLLQGIRVLVVDDEPDMRELIVTILEQAGAIAQMAASASEALAVLDQFQPMLLVSDIGMPETDGYELMRQIRNRASISSEQTPGFPQTVPKAIALTAYAMEQDQQQAFAAGFQRHLAKPIEPEVLIKAIVALMNQE
ncbi:MAG TPA: PAS domain-containing protein [Candidatus Obscuribacterales bacterium]